MISRIAWMCLDFLVDRVENETKGHFGTELIGVQFVRIEGKAAVCEVQSGRYAFASSKFARP